MGAQRIHLSVLLHAGRLLLEYNESTAGIHRALLATAKSLTDATCHVSVSYRGVLVALAAEGPVMMPVKELRFDMAVQARVHEILYELRKGKLDATTALHRLENVESVTRRYSRWLVAIALGAAASSFAALLGADKGAVAVAGLATALGLLARQELGRRQFSLLTLPLAAAFIGALLGGIAIRLVWTQSPELVLMVPALMLVPGVHLINGVLDLIDNYLTMSLSRLGLAAGILLACALGVVLGVELTLPGAPPFQEGANATHLTLTSDVALAGIATCGFAMFFNVRGWQLLMATAGGMAGHGIRYVALDMDGTIEAATFLGGFAVGCISAWIARTNKTPVAVTAFAGTVTMIPGLTLYRTLGGALKLARMTDMTDPRPVAETLGNALLGSMVVGGLALGLILGTRVVAAIVAEQEGPNLAYVGHNADESS